jgi:hypothetical protein
MKSLEKRLRVLENRRMIADLVEPGPDASELERYAFRVRTCAASHGQAMDQAKALRLAESVFVTLEEMDRVTRGDVG